MSTLNDRKSLLKAFRRRKAITWTKKDYNGKMSLKDVLQIDDVVKNDSLKKVKPPLLDRDEITGYRFRVTKHAKFFGSSRGNGLMSLDDIPANTIAFVSTKPGIKVSLKTITNLKKKKYYFIKRWFFSKREIIMTANCPSMENGQVAEKVNATLETCTSKRLKRNNLPMICEGTFGVIRTLQPIKANSFVLVDYSNKRDFPFGTQEYLQKEKSSITEFEMNKTISARSPRKQVCKNCSQIYESNKINAKVTHNLFCTGKRL